MLHAHPTRIHILPPTEQVRIQRPPLHGGQTQIRCRDMHRFLSSQPVAQWFHRPYNAPGHPPHILGHGRRIVHVVERCIYRIWRRNRPVETRAPTLLSGAKSFTVAAATTNSPTFSPSSSSSSSSSSSVCDDASDLAETTETCTTLCSVVPVEPGSAPSSSSSSSSSFDTDAGSCTSCRSSSFTVCELL